MNLSNEKGRALERAVHAIEAVILESSPDLRENAFRIETRKQIIVGGVHHEIDIFVTVDAAPGYTSTFIFECKNWATPVDKNEIMIFGGKIGLAVAQQGYFVAKSFTKDAVLQAALDPRIKLLTATEYDPALISAAEIFQRTEPAGCNHLLTTFRVMGTTGTKEVATDVKGKMAHICGQDVLLEDYLNAWTGDLYNQCLLTFQTGSLSEGIHPMPTSAERVFAARECIIDGQEMEYVRLDAEFLVKLDCLTVISDFEVSTRGRVIRLNPYVVRGILVDPAIVRLPNEE